VRSKKKGSHDREFFLGVRPISRQRQGDYQYDALPLDLRPFDFDSRRLFVIWIVACSFVACSSSRVHIPASPLLSTAIQSSQNARSDSETKIITKVR
jgi:hypothetical protein